jgi:hypothetical protein
MDADLDTFVADVHVRPSYQLSHLVLALAAKRAKGACAKVVHALGVGLLVLMEIAVFVAVFDEADGEHRVASLTALDGARRPARRAGRRKPSSTVLETLYKQFTVSKCSRFGGVFMSADRWHFR